MNKEQLAKEAERILREPALVHALGAMRADSLEELAAAPAQDTAEIAKWQAQVAAIDEFRERLEAYIRDGSLPPERPGFA